MGQRALYQPIYNLDPVWRVLTERAPTMSHDDLARHIGCSRSHLYRLQARQRQPSRVMAERLAAITGLDVLTLVERVDGPDESEETAQTASGAHEHGQV